MLKTSLPNSYLSRPVPWIKICQNTPNGMNLPDLCTTSLRSATYMHFAVLPLINMRMTRTECRTRLGFVSNFQ